MTFNNYNKGNHFKKLLDLLDKPTEDWPYNYDFFNIYKPFKTI